ncbi:MAG: peptidoglycan-binding domain-containing protein [Pseudomonadota bacterium]
MKQHLLAGLLALATALPSWAEDAVLLVAVGDYLRIEDTERRHQSLTSLREAYRDAGYTVFFELNKSRDDITRSFAAIEDQMDRFEHLVIHVFGRGAAKHNDLYLLPRDFAGQGLARLSLNGISVQMMLDLAGRKPGKSAVFLGLEETDLGLPANIRRPLSVPDAPGGVFVALGAPKEMADAAERVFLRRGASLAQAAASAPVASAGDASAAWVMNAAPPAVGNEAGPSIVERTLWRLAQDNPTEANVQAYLDRFPNGLYAAQAREMLAKIEAEKVDPAEAAEQALALTRADRREIQEHLTLLGYDTRGIDGIFGPGTRGAITKWQTAEALQPSGFVDAEQRVLLTRRANAKRAQLKAEEDARKREAELADIAFWRATGASGTPEDLRAYLARYPEGIYAAAAKRQLEPIEAAERAQAQAAEQADWDAVQSANTAQAYESYLATYPSGAFVDAAKAKLAELNRNQASQAQVAQYQRTERSLGLNSASLALIEQRLKILNYDVGRVDGKLDAQARAAIKDFQQRQGVTPTGYLTSGTLQQLIVASSR